MIRGALAAVIAAAAMLGGCATKPPLAAIDGDRFSGRLALKVEGDAAKSMSAGFELEGGAQRGRLSLTTPLGTQVAQARWAPGEVVLAGSFTRPEAAHLGDHFEADYGPLGQMSLRFT